MLILTIPGYFFLLDEANPFNQSSTYEAPSLSWFSTGRWRRHWIEPSWIAMIGEERQPGRLRTSLQRRHVSEKSLSQPKPLGKYTLSAPSSIGEKQQELPTSLDVNPGPSESGNSGLWGEVYDTFMTSNASPDLRDVARLLRIESRDDFSLSANASDGGTKVSREWRLCKEILRLAETKKTELIKGTEGRLIEKVRRSYSEIITWVQKFVALGDVVCQIDPIHIGLPWAGVRAILIVCMRFSIQRWGRWCQKIRQISIHDHQIQTEILAGIASLARLVCRYAVFEEVYLQDSSLLREPLKLKLKAALKTLYLAAFRYLVEVTLHLKRTPIG